MSAFTQEELDYIKARHDIMTPEEIGKRLGRPAFAIKRMLESMGVASESHINKHNEWTDADVAYLMVKYGKVRTDTIAKKLGRTHASVNAKANSLGLSYSKQNRKKREAEIEKKCKAIYDNKTAELLNIKVRPTDDDLEDGGLDFFEQLYMQVVNLSVQGKGNRWVADQMGWPLSQLKKYKEINNIVI